MTKVNNLKNLQKNPENTGLEVIHDNRSGDKLEIVIPVFNEEKRIANILSYYHEFDIVLMDGGSTDRTIEMAIQGNATVYRRVGEPIGENHFIYYVNKITKSGYCFYMMADHFTNKSNLIETHAHLKNKNSVVRVRQIEWFYGENPNTDTSRTLGMARGFRRGTAGYDPVKFHDSLHHVNNTNDPDCVLIFDLHHLHIRSVKNEYGKIGRYLDAEIYQLIKKKATFYRYFRRFIVPFIVFVLFRVWFNKTSMPRKILKIMEIAISAQIALMCWIEQKFMPSVEEQADYHSSIYKSTKNANDMVIAPDNSTTVNSNA